MSIPPSVPGSPDQPQYAVCPNCRQSVVAGTTVCPFCGAQISTVPSPSYPLGYTAPGAPTPEQRKRNERNIIIAVVLICVVVAAVAGIALYANQQRLNQVALQAAQAADRSGASDAVDQMYVTCSSFNYDTSGVPYTASLYITFGVKNPTSYSIDSTWTLDINYVDAHIDIASSQTFHDGPQGISYPKWTFTLNAAQISALNGASSSAFKGSLTRTFVVHGTLWNV